MSDMSTELTNYIGKQLRSIRLQKKMTQREVAGAAGMDSNAYAKVERGLQSPNVETLAKIVKALSIKSSDLLPF